MSSRCEVCGSKARLLRCSGCRAVFYCGRDHQSVDRPSHKRGCAAVKHARDVFEREEQAIRNSVDTADPFEPAADTRPYVSARFLLADALLKNFGSIRPRAEAVATALNHLLNLLASNRADPLYLRNVIPALYIILNMDQHAYDFVRWWATSYSRQPGLDWTDPSLPYLDTRDADILEPLAEEWTWSTKRDLEIYHPVIVMVLKIRVLLDLVAVRRARQSLSGVLPPEIIDMVQDHLVNGIVASRPEILRQDTDQISRHIESLRRQITHLCIDINKANPYFWPMMLDAFRDPASAIENRPIGYSGEPKEEARYVTGYTVAAWIVEPAVVGTMYEVLRSIARGGMSFETIDSLFPS
ncbi:hypothetical protein VUR80DRAFT_7867 [Thermomyces stellatus]